MLKLIKYTAAHLKWNALRALLQIAGWYLVVEHTNCSILNVQRSKSAQNQLKEIVVYDTNGERFL